MELIFDLKAHSVQAVETACYRFLDRFAAVLSVDSDVVRVNVDFSSEVTDHPEVLRAFKAEVIDQSLREKIADQTKLERNLILSYAFSRTGLMDAK